MFASQAFNKIDMTFESKVTMTLNQMTCLEFMNGGIVLEEHCASYDTDNARFDSDSDFYDLDEAMNAYNKVFETMKPLFA